MAIPYLDLALPALAFMAGVLLFAGTIKGTSGIGLPMTSIPLIAWVTDAPTAIAIMAAPVLATDLFLSVENRKLLRASARRFWPLFMPLALATIPAAHLLTSVDPAPAC